MRKLTLAAAAIASAFAGFAELSYTRQALFPGFDGKFCKMGPSVMTDGNGLAVMSYGMLLLSGSDVFYGSYVSRSTDDGVTWSEPRKVTELPDTHEHGLRVTHGLGPCYNRAGRRWFGLGLSATYENDKVPLNRVIEGRPYNWPIWGKFDPKTMTFSGPEKIEFPIPYSSCYSFGQMVELENGDMLLCFNYEPIELVEENRDAYLIRGRIVVARCRFVKDRFTIVELGRPIACDGLRRGVGEPSLIRLGGKFYMTVRSDEAGMWCESDDGLNYSAPKRWAWTDDGKEIENRNTQQHWMKAGEKLYLAYTRVTPTNGHVFRNRAPVFLAEFDPKRGGLKRETETPVVPERGARLGNFCCTEDGRGGSWLITAEWMQPIGCEKYGSDNSLWLVKVKEVPKQKRGALLLTFDDALFDNWDKALSLFDRYGAHATFFANGELDDRKLMKLRTYQSYGHSVGLHGREHVRSTPFVKEKGMSAYLKTEIEPQLASVRKSGLVIKNFAYPCSDRNEDTDVALKPYFSRMRTGVGRDPKTTPLADFDAVFYDRAELAKMTVIPGTGYGSDFPGIAEDIEKALERAASRDEALVLYSHDIKAKPDGDPHNTSIDVLERILSKASELGVAVIGFDEIVKWAAGEVRYFANDGDDAADGRTPATAWRTLEKLSADLPSGGTALLKRGDVFFGGISLVAGLDEQHPTVLADYGEGPKPVLSAVKIVKNDPAIWEQRGFNMWRVDLVNPTNYAGAASADCNPGFLIVDGELKPWKRYCHSDLVSPWDFCGEDNWLYVHSEKNPALVAKEIVVSLNIHCVIFHSHTVISNIAVHATGAHGMYGGWDPSCICENVHISDCEFENIGGSELPGYSEKVRVRYGNGVEFGSNCRKALIERCSFKGTYDVAFTMQGYPTLTGWEDVTVRNCTMTDCSQAFEIWCQKAPKGMGFTRCAFISNRTERVGGGWGELTRPARQAATPLLIYAMQTDTVDIDVSGNTFIDAPHGLIYAAGGPSKIPAGYRIHDNTLAPAHTATSAMSAGPVMPDIFKKGETILFIGDSVTHGGRCGDMNHYLGHGYQAEISMRYLGYHPELDLQFANRGISGDSSSNVVARWRSDAFPFTPDETGYEGPYPGMKGVKRIPDWISIFVGLNDDWDLKYVTPADTEKNLRFMIEDARKHNPKIKIVLCEPYSPTHNSSAARAKTAVRGEIVRRLAAEYGVILVSFPQLFDELMKEKPQSKWWIWDSCHPTYAAHMRMADFWLQTVAAAMAPGPRPCKNGD